MTPSEEVALFRASFPAKAMKRGADNPDQLRQMTTGDGMMELPSPIASRTQFIRHSAIPNSKESAKEARHLWVIRPDDFPVALEKCEWGSKLLSKEIKHSNLTGGNSAHSGGEIWFIGDNQVAVNASSGRYGADSAYEFNLIVEALRRSGYRVASMGFDLENPTVPNKIFVGEPDWHSVL